ncbi:hypothetical protein [Acanthopleuribacter pedis]|uniref:Uncharacterized protein n=1 Tax=Acanthopleuribacter pedis TaxID=442870 RepID=A0A8J7U8N6_9BACT|nr:hypothetical protein [Acanthopleuribacter pedis]MBO1322761.1 hypothetical protein [Acanthopleuribacter pedis]
MNKGSDATWYLEMLSKLGMAGGFLFCLFLLAAGQNSPWPAVWVGSMSLLGHGLIKLYKKRLPWRLRHQSISSLVDEAHQIGVTQRSEVHLVLGDVLSVLHDPYQASLKNGELELTGTDGRLIAAVIDAVQAYGMGLGQHARGRLEPTREAIQTDGGDVESLPIRYARVLWLLGDVLTGELTARQKTQLSVAQADWDQALVLVVRWVVAHQAAREGNAADARACFQALAVDAPSLYVLHGPVGTLSPSAPRLSGEERGLITPESGAP